MQDLKHEDVRMEIVVGNLLRTGVILSACVVLIGAAVYLPRHGFEKPNYTAFHGEPPQLRSLQGIVTMALSMKGRGILQLGMLLLIATPVARVAFSVYGFARERDFRYVVITLIVLGLLVYSLVGS